MPLFKRIAKFRYFLTLLIFCVNIQTSGQRVSGIIYLENGKFIECIDIIKVAGIVEQNNRSNNNRVFKLFYENTISIIPLAQIKFIKVKEYQTAISESGISILKNIKLQIETKNKLFFETPYFELFWVTAKVYDEFAGNRLDQIILFNQNGKLNIRQIVFD